MTNAAIARRPDFFPFGDTPKDYHEIAHATAAPPAVPLPPGGVPPPAPQGVPAPQSGASAQTNVGLSAMQVIAAYIPTEIITLYVACISVLHKAEEVTLGEWIAFDVFTIATPCMVWVVFAVKLKTAQKPIPASPSRWPVWEMCAATIAFIAWAYAMPNSPFSEFTKQGWYSAGLAGLMVLIVSTMLGAISPLFQRPLMGN